MAAELRQCERAIPLPSSPDLPHALYVAGDPYAKHRADRLAVCCMDRTRVGGLKLSLRIDPGRVKARRREVVWAHGIFRGIAAGRVARAMHEAVLHTAACEQGRAAVRAFCFRG
jgi:hypothetical protein